MSETYFFITAIETATDKLGKYKRGHCSGFMDTLEGAERSVLENDFDLCEGGTNEWVIIEEYMMGSFAPLVGLDIIGENKERWYHWVSSGKYEGKYERCEKPEWSEGICHWGLG